VIYLLNGGATDASPVRRTFNDAVDGVEGSKRDRIATGGCVLVLLDQ
jgi:hypothetical protein